MRIPGFTAAASLEASAQSYLTIADRADGGGVRPALSRQNCFRLCGGDDDCVACCLCVQRGGNPTHCCI
ncbi:hypothetical protein [Rhodopila sp.]|uniref:hypothetical protein n=1 Tax=Rhodopila sp. TaxID=2480087 RepID=UPI003D0D1DCB